VVGTQVESKRGEAVVLIHGLWMTGTEMRVLGVRLEEAGFRVRYFRYRSWRGGLAQAAGALREFAEATEGSGFTLSGTAWGRRDREDARGSSPLPAGPRGDAGGSDGRSAAARIVSRRRAGRWLVGGVIREGIVEHAPKWPGGRELLVVAGNIPLGRGFSRSPQAHDGSSASKNSRRRSADGHRTRVACRLASFPESGRAPGRPLPGRLTGSVTGDPIFQRFAPTDVETGSQSARLMNGGGSKGKSQDVDNNV